MSEADVPLRVFAERFYAQPGVAPLLIGLQDQAGLDVLLLLGACWLGHRGVPAQACDWPATAAWQRPWQSGVVGPLRAARRQVREIEGATLLYEQLKACELAAEWRQLERLAERWSSLVGRGVRGGSTQEHLLACCRAQDVRVPGELDGKLLELTRLVPAVV